MKSVVIFCSLICSFLCAKESNPYDLEKIYPYAESDFFKNQEPIEKLLKARDINTILQVGCWYGKSTIFMAKRIPENGTIYAVDSWIGYPRSIYKNTLNVYPMFLSNMLHAGVSDKVVPIHMTSLSAAKRFAEWNVLVDMIYIDCDHAYEAVYSDLKAWSPYLRKGGGLCGNLYSTHGNTKIIKKAVSDYCNAARKRVRFQQYFWIIED